MEVLISGKDFIITDDVRNHINEKLSKLSFAEDRITKVSFVIITTPINTTLCELDVFVDHNKVFASHEHSDWRVAITDAINKVHDMIIRERKKKKDSKIRESKNKRQ
ncbi:MAG: ribosome hibernation-promoting factor, HPF/YfiA family [Brevinematia bacterium]